MRRDGWQRAPHEAPCGEATTVLKTCRPAPACTPQEKLQPRLCPATYHPNLQDITTHTQRWQLHIPCLLPKPQSHILSGPPPPANPCLPCTTKASGRQATLTTTDCRSLAVRLVRACVTLRVPAMRSPLPPTGARSGCCQDRKGKRACHLITAGAAAECTYADLPQNQQLLSTASRPPRTPTATQGQA